MSSSWKPTNLTVCLLLLLLCFTLSSGYSPSCLKQRKEVQNADAQGTLTRRQTLASSPLLLAGVMIDATAATPALAAAAEYQDGPRGLKYLVTTPGARPVGREPRNQGNAVGF